MVPLLVPLVCACMCVFVVVAPFVVCRLFGNVFVVGVCVCVVGIVVVVCRLIDVVFVVGVSVCVVVIVVVVGVFVDVSFCGPCTWLCVGCGCL